MAYMNQEKKKKKRKVKKLKKRSLNDIKRNNYRSTSRPSE